VKAERSNSLLGTAALTAFALASLAPLAYVLVRGGGYWLLNRTGQAQHEAFAQLSSGGPWGVLLGVLGTLLMTVMLLYTARKMLVSVRWLGAISGWLRFHIVCGVVGPILILAHTGLVWPTGLIAVGFWCMVAVALSGVFGRYVYGFFPRMADGRQLEWDDAMRELAALRATLVADTASLKGDRVGEAVLRVRDFEHRADGLLDLIGLQREVKRREREVASILSDCGLPEGARRQATDTLCEQLRLRRGLEATRVAHRMMRYWHLFHRPLAAAMYVIVVLHIASAVLLGGSLQQLLLLEW
jgi:hypothetical protein